MNLKGVILGNKASLRNRMRQTEFHIPGMDCPSEEQIIRLRLGEMDKVHHLRFDLNERKLWVTHELDEAFLYNNLLPLGFGARIISTQEGIENVPEEVAVQRRALIYVLLINAFFFMAELVAGLISGSMGLLADSLDMLADALVYTLSLLATGRSMRSKRHVARISGYFQLSLAVLGFFEVLRRFLSVSAMPDHLTMIWVSMLALLGNLACLWILRRAASQDVHMKASWIFTSNDVAANLGVIIAGICVIWLDSSLPDLIIGTLVFLLVARGAWRILKLSRVSR